MVSDNRIFLFPGFFIHIRVRVHIILLSADPVPTPHDHPSVCYEMTYAMHVFFFLWDLFITNMS